jgi:hypothetical protein
MESRTEFEQEIVQALVESKAIDFEAAGSILAKYGARAALSENEIHFIVTKQVHWACGNPGPLLRDVVAEQG